MSLARTTDDPVLKQRYEALALEFAQKLGAEQDVDITVPCLAPKPTSNGTIDLSRRLCTIIAIAQFLQQHRLVAVG